MILYLNKNINENTNNPFRSRFNYTTALDINNNPLNNGSFGLPTNTSNDLNLNNLNNNKYLGQTLNPINIKSNLETNINLDTNLNMNSLNKYSNNIEFGVNTNNEANNGLQSQTSNKQVGNYFQNSLSSQSSGMIMPETNFTGFNKSKDITNKYMNNNNTEIGLGSGGSLLAHKYGNKNSMSIHNENNINEKYGMSASKTSEYNNLEEEYPRALAQPQSQIIRK